MPNINVTIRNIGAIKAAFNKSPILMTKELNTAIAETVITIRRKSMINTPVLTGRLRGSHYSKFSNLKGEVGTDTNYDLFVHNGTRFMAARPYLQTAVVDSDAETNKFFTKAVDNVLSEIARNV